MKEKVLLLITVLVICLIACDKQTNIQELQDIYVTENVEDTIKEEITEPTEDKDTYVDYNEIEHEIVFVYQYVNYAEFLYNYGYYIDEKGNRVEFNIPIEDMKRDSIWQYDDINNLLSYLNDMEFVECKAALRETEMRQYYEWLCSISSQYSIEEVCAVQDYGYERLYGIRYPKGSDTPEIIKIHEQGDWIRVNTDEYAQKLSDVDELIEKWNLEHFGYSEEKKKFIQEE